MSGLKDEQGTLDETPFDNAVHAGIEEALSLVRENELPYHNVEHTVGVMRRTSLILSAINGPSPTELGVKHIGLGCVAGAFHDAAQEWEAGRRRVGYNEKQSADTAADFMRSMVGLNGEPIFTTSDIDLVREAILTTIPSFDTENNTVVQPYLKTTSSPIALALALADLGAAGMDGPETFIPEGDALFWEENPDILNALKNPTSLTEEDKNGYRQRMLAWSRSQPKFAFGRKVLLPTELAGLPPNAQSRVAALFDKFDLSIKASTNVALKREETPFEKMILDMGYKG